MISTVIHYIKRNVSMIIIISLMVLIILFAYWVSENVIRDIDSEVPEIGMMENSLWPFTSDPRIVSNPMLRLAQPQPWATAHQPSHIQILKSPCV